MLTVKWLYGTKYLLQQISCSFEKKSWAEKENHKKFQKKMSQIDLDSE